MEFSPFFCYCIFHQIIVALVNIIYFFQKQNLTNSKPLNFVGLGFCVYIWLKSLLPRI